MLKTFYIKPNERGFLYHQSDFKTILAPGTHRYFGWNWQVKTYDLNQPQASIEQLELLLQTHRDILTEHLTIVRTEFDRVALVRVGQNWVTVAPNSLQAFWRGFIPIEVHNFNLAEDLELPTALVQKTRGYPIVGVKKLEVSASEIGMLFVQNNFIKFLDAGEYAVWSLGQNIGFKTLKLDRAEAQIDQLELLLQTHGEMLERYLTIVKTESDRVALVKVGQNWTAVTPNSIHAFWKGFIPVEVHNFNLTESLELPANLVEQTRGFSLTGLKRFQIAEAEIGLLYIQQDFIRPLNAGEYAFWSVSKDVACKTLTRAIPNPIFPDEDILVDRHPAFIAEYCTVAQTIAHQVAIVRDRQKPIAILPPCHRKLFWQGVTVETIEIGEDAKLSERLIAEWVAGSAVTKKMSGETAALHVQEVLPQHLGLFYIDGVFQGQLQPGIHAWWLFNRSIKSISIDLRLQTMEVSGQDILTKDKVPLRLNLTAGYRISDPLQASNSLVDITGFLYKELQFALRGAVGERTLDGLLEDKGTIDRDIAEYIHQKTTDYGLTVESVGIKDIILPGEIRTILSKVVEAEKSAQANVVRRREETAATRSMLNTAKVMEDNPVALRLKELEVLERIAEKIDRIQVNGSLDSILTDLINIKTTSR